MSSYKPAYCFLDFPPEIRLRIYRYLVPTQDPWSSYKSRGSASRESNEGPYPRHNSLSCSPELLSTCKMVYSELVEEFYSQDQFPALIHSGGIHFFNDKYETAADLPIAFHFIEDIKITLVFHGDKEDQLASSAKNQHMITLLCALIAKMPSLQKLELQFTLPQKFFSNFNGKLNVTKFGSAALQYFRFLARTVRATKQFRKETSTRFTFHQPQWSSVPWHLDWLLYSTQGFLTAWINRTASQPHLHWQTLLGDLEDEQHIAWGRCGFVHAWEADWW